MASTGELVSWIKQAKSGWARQNDIIPVIREVVNILCKVESAQFLILDTGTGRPPLLSTTQYNFGPYAGPTGSWRVSQIMLKEPAFDYGSKEDAIYAEKPYVNTSEPIEINGNWYYPFPFVSSVDAINGALPQIMFSRDPGTNDAKYYQRAYRSPVQIMSDRIQLPIPDSYGCHRLYVLPACLALIEAMDHGNYADGLVYIEGTIKPLMWKVLNGGEQGKRHRVTMRPY
jgi:hypothetical protein